LASCWRVSRSGPVPAGAFQRRADFSQPQRQRFGRLPAEPQRHFARRDAASRRQKLVADVVTDFLTERREFTQGEETNLTAGFTCRLRDRRIDDDKGSEEEQAGKFA